MRVQCGGVGWVQRGRGWDGVRCAGGWVVSRPHGLALGTGKAAGRKGFGRTAMRSLALSAPPRPHDPPFSPPHPTRPQELKLQLRDGCELPPQAAAALGAIAARQLRSLTLVGGTIGRDAMAALLGALAGPAASPPPSPPTSPPSTSASASRQQHEHRRCRQQQQLRPQAQARAQGGACRSAPGPGPGPGLGPGLRSLTLLPSLGSGLGDDDVPALLRGLGGTLEALEFRAYRWWKGGAGREWEWVWGACAWCVYVHGVCTLEGGRGDARMLPLSLRSGGYAFAPIHSSNAAPPCSPPPPLPSHPFAITPPQCLPAPPRPPTHPHGLHRSLAFWRPRLTSAGLAALSSGLPLLTRLAITSLDCDR